MIKRGQRKINRSETKAVVEHIDIAEKPGRISQLGSAREPPHVALFFRSGEMRQVTAPIGDLLVSPSPAPPTSCDGEQASSGAGVPQHGIQLGWLAPSDARLRRRPLLIDRSSSREGAAGGGGSSPGVFEFFGGFLSPPYPEGILIGRRKSVRCLPKVGSFKITSRLFVARARGAFWLLRS